MNTACPFHNFDLGVGGQKNNCSYFLEGHKQDFDLFSDKTKAMRRQLHKACLGQRDIMGGKMFICQRIILKIPLRVSS